MNKTHKIALTPGEPAGIGPDCVLLLSEKEPELFRNIIVYADSTLLEERAERLGLSSTGIKIHHIPLTTKSCPGELDILNAQYVLSCLEQATQSCMDNKTQALVTGPVHKGVINKAGFKFTGHTEFLAQLCKIKHTVMLFVADNKRVALATTHIPLKEVSSAITIDYLKDKINVLYYGLKTNYSIQHPKILVCGINPHAGEDGTLGKEENNVIRPVLESFNKNDIDIKGPVSADTAFCNENFKNYDCILAMYHDQGLTPIKSNNFGELVNVTLGLPFIRTSVDHGTALTIAGTDKVKTESLKQAIIQANAIIEHRKNNG